MYDYPIEQDVSNAYYNLIFFFIIILILAFFVYVSFVVSTKQRDRVDISKADFDLFENQANKPDLLLTGEPNQAKQLDYSTIHDFASIRYCPAGQCVVNKKDGSKRCPENTTDALTYSTTHEDCTRPFYCDSIQVPYAVRSDGSALDKYCGDDILKCRCTATPQCPYYVTSTFDMGNGSVYGVNNNQLNYYFSINTGENGYFNKNPITIAPDDLGGRFCKLNPAFTNRIPNGCVFSDSINDPIDCQDSDLFQLLDDDDVTVALVPSNFSRYSKYPCPHSFATYNTGDTSISIYSTKPILTQGMYTITIDGIDYELYYKGFTESQFIQSHALEKVAGSYTCKLIQDAHETYTVYTLHNILGRKKDEVSWSTGLPFKKVFLKPQASGDTIEVLSTTPTSDRPRLTPIVIRFQPCTNDRPIANFKNMLRCVQTDEQPCTSGTLAYNIDKIIDSSTTLSLFEQNNSRNFCNAYDSSRLDASVSKSFYLNDPGSFTTSCVIGPGCDGTFDSNLCTDSDCNQAIIDRKNNFFDKYDDSAVRNYWVLTANEPTGFPTLSLTTSGNPVQIGILNDSMFSLEPGDYWARHTPPINKFLKKDANIGVSILTLNNTSGLSIGYEVQYPGYSTPQTITKIDTSNNTITLNNPTGISIIKNTGIEIIDLLASNEFGLIGNNKNSYYLLDIGGSSGVTLNPSEIDIIKTNGIVIYKQFAFNGINYNTKFTNSSPPVRYYSDSYVNKVFLSGSVRPPYTFLAGKGITNDNLSTSASIAFNNDSSVFKDNKSMYYPVWNSSNFRQECVMCRPSFFAFAGVNPDNTLESAQIQFSAQNFFNYAHNIKDNNYVYTTFTRLDKNLANIDRLASNTNYLVVEDINTNIEIGDYVLDSTGYMDRIYQANGTITVGTKMQLSKPEVTTVGNITVNSIMPNSLLQPFKLIDKFGKEFTFDSTGFITTAQNSNTTAFSDASSDGPYAKNFFMGTAYNDGTAISYEIIPVAKIVDIIDPTGGNNKNVLITDNGILRTIVTSEDVFIQTIKMKEFLNIEVIQDLGDSVKNTGVGATVTVDEISSGRITNVSITNKGSGYSVENRPSIILNKFNSGDEINILI